MVINGFAAIISENIFADVDVAEKLNVYTGDVDQKRTYRFCNKSGMDIGYANIYFSGDHAKITGDYNGRRIVEKYQLVK